MVVERGVVDSELNACIDVADDASFYIVVMEL